MKSNINKLRHLIKILNCLGLSKFDCLNCLKFLWFQDSNIKRAKQG